MSITKFHVGDRVRSTEKDEFIEVNDVGTVMEDCNFAPLVKWDGKIWKNRPDGFYSKPSFSLEVIQ